MEKDWWEAPELDGVLWRNNPPNWNRMKKEKREAWISRFDELFPLSGEYSDSVKERAVYRWWRRQEVWNQRHSSKVFIPQCADKNDIT